MNFCKYFIFVNNLMICGVCLAGGGENEGRLLTPSEAKAKADAEKAAIEADLNNKKQCATQDLAIVVGLKPAITNALVGFDNSLPIWARENPSVDSGKSLAVTRFPTSNSLLVTIDPRSAAINQILSGLYVERQSLPDDFSRYIYLKTLFVRKPEWNLRVGPGPGFLGVDKVGDLEKRMRDFRGGLFRLASYRKEIEQAWNFQPNAYGWPSSVMSFDISKWKKTFNIFPLQTTNLNFAFAVEGVWERAINKVYNGKPLNLVELEDLCSAVMYDYKILSKMTVEDFLKLEPMTELVKAAYYYEVRQKTQNYLDFWRAFKLRQDNLSKAGIADISLADLHLVEQEYSSLALTQAWRDLDSRVSKFFSESPLRRNVRDDILKDLQAKDRRADWIASKLYNFLLTQKKIEEIGADSSIHEAVAQYLKKTFGAVGEIAPEKSAEFDAIFGEEFFRELELAKARRYSNFPISAQVHISKRESGLNKGYYSATDLPGGLHAKDGLVRDKEEAIFRPKEPVEIPDYVSAVTLEISKRFKSQNNDVVVTRFIEGRIADYVRFVALFSLAQDLNKNQVVNASDLLQSLLTGNLEGFRNFEVDGFKAKDFAKWASFETFLNEKATAELAAIQKKLPQFSEMDLSKNLSPTEVQLREFKELALKNENFPKLPSVQVAKDALVEYLSREDPIDEASLIAFAKSLALNFREPPVELRQSLLIWIREATPTELQNRLKLISYRDFMLGSF